MKKSLSNTYKLKSTFNITAVLLLISFILFSSFTVGILADDFLKQLGISKASADQKIINSILGGSLDAYGARNIRNILAGDRKAVALDLLNYTKAQVNSPAFISQYTILKENNKPTFTVPQTPEQMRAANIAAAKQGIKDMEASIQKADANTKPIFEKVLVDAKKNLEKAEDPNNKSYVSYAKNYEGLLRDIKVSNDAQLANWERKYPSNHLLYVKMRLQEFMEATNNIDFEAELTVKNGKKIFVNPVYENKGSRWKMAFRAGKEVVEPARAFVQQWIAEIQ